MLEYNEKLLKTKIMVNKLSRERRQEADTGKKTPKTKRLGYPKCKNGYNETTEGNRS